MGIYSLYYRFWDETGECPSSFTTFQRFNCSTGVSVIPDKNTYNYLDSANINVIVTGAGNYTIHFTCAEAGVNETRNVQIPEGVFKIEEMFQVPIGINISSIYNLNVEVKNALSPISQTRTVPVSPLQFDYNGHLSEPLLMPVPGLHLNWDMKPLSGTNAKGNIYDDLQGSCSVINYYVLEVLNKKNYLKYIV